jgi:proteasome assembly chaperone (PAC2) family protein
MEAPQLSVIDQPTMSGGSMVLGFNGWMDGGDVSTGTVDWFTRKLGALPVAEISPEGFYLYSFPGSMETAALFRPQIKIEEGLVVSVRPPANTFFCDTRSKVVLFNGVEPNLKWDEFAECIFAFAKRSGVTTIYFVGSYAGMVPHTREARISTIVSDIRLKPVLERYGLSFNNYEGPGSFSVYMTARARRHNLSMVDIVAEIPSYIQGPNPKAIQAVARKLQALLGLQLNLDDLQTLSDAWEQRVNEALESKNELIEFINKLEEAYDKEMFDTQLGDFKEWLEGQGIRLE